MLLIQFIIVTGFVLVHLFAGKLRFLDGIPRSRWLSTAGGISVAYVFMHVFPELARAQERFNETGRFVQLIEHHAYIMALLGLALFYGLERIVKADQRRKRARLPHEYDESSPGTGVFWLHISSFGIYNALIGALLVHREESGLRELLMFAVAMALHFLVNDFGLRQDHQEAYRNSGRWVLVVAVVVGWLTGLATEVEAAVVDVLFAFLAGGVILNVLKEELPEERASRFLPFAAGAAGYAVLLLFL